MSTVRKAIAAVAVAGTLAIAPLAIIAGQAQQAADGHSVTVNGQGSWPFRV